MGAAKSDQTLDNTANITARSTSNHFNNLINGSKGMNPLIEGEQLCLSDYVARTERIKYSRENIASYNSPSCVLSISAR